MYHVNPYIVFYLMVPKTLYANFTKFSYMVIFILFKNLVPNARMCHTVQVCHYFYKCLYFAFAMSGILLVVMWF